VPPQKKSKKNTLAETCQQDHHRLEGNEISFVPESSNITNQEWRAKLEALMKARAEKTSHIQEQPAEQQTHENDDDNDDTIDRELEIVQQKIQQLQKEKEKFASQLQAKRKISEKLEQLNQAREQIETIQIEIDQMKEQENSSLWQDSPHQNSGPTRTTPKENFFMGNGISQFVDSESPLSIGLQTAPWPPKFKPVSLPKYNDFGNSRQFLMRYESVVNSAGGDDVALAKSFIIACEGPVLNWYSLLPPHSVCSWVDLKTKFMQAFQMFHDTTAEASDLYSCKQKDREPLRNFVRRFMQQRSQIPEVDEKTVINVLIKGLTPGPTASHLTRKKPKTVEELFHELEEYILSDDDHRKRVAERNEARQGNREMTWRAQSQNPRNVNNVENPQPDQNNRPSVRGGFATRGRGRGRGPPRLTNHNPRDPYFYCQCHERGHSNEGCPETKKNMARIQQEKALMSIASSMPNQFRPNLWQPQFMNSQPSPVAIQQFSQPQSSWQPSQQFFPQSQAIQSIQQPQPIREILPPPLDSLSRPQSSSGPQSSKALPSFGTIMPISGGSAMEFETKKQRSN
jgi:hypothetical protein